MAQGDNVIEVVVKAVDQLSAQVLSMKGQLDAFSTSVEKVSSVATKSQESLSGIEKTSHATEEAVTGAGAAVIALNSGLELGEKVFGPFVEFLKEASLDAGKFEQQIVELTTTMQIFGKSANPQSIIDFSDEMRKTQNVTRELALGVASDLAVFTDLGRGADASGEKLKKLTEITIALAKVTGRSPEFQAIQIANFLSQPAATSFGRGLTAPQGLTLDEKQNFLIERYGGLINLANREQDTFIGQLTRMKLALEGVGHVLGGEYNESLKGYLTILGDIFESTESFLEEHEKLAAALAKVGAIAGTVIVVLGGLAAIKFAASIAAVAEFGAAFAAIAAGPIGAVVVAIGAVVAGVLALKALTPTESTDDKIKQIQQVIDRLERARSAQTSPQDQARTQAAIDAQKAVIENLRENEITSHTPVEEITPVDSKEADRLKSLEKRANDFAIASAAAMIKAQGDVQAAAQKLIFDETGSVDALIASFDIRIATARAAGSAKIAAKIDALAKEAGITPKELQQKAPGVIATETKPIAAETDTEIQKIRQDQRKALFDIDQKSFQVSVTNQKALLDGEQALLDNDKERLKVIQETGAPLSDQLALINKNADAQRDITERTILNLQGELQRQQDIANAIGVQNDKRVEAQTKEAAINTEITKQQKLLNQLPLDVLKQKEEARASAAKITTNEITAQIDALQSLRDLDQRRIDLLNAQAQAEGKQSAPYTELLALAAEQDRLEAAILQKKIAQQQVEVDLARQRQQNNPTAANEALLKVAEAQLESIANQAEFVKTHVLDLAQQLKVESLQIADSISGEFANQFLDGIQGALNGSKQSFKQFLDSALISIGKTIVAQFLREAVASAIEPQIEALRASGEKVPSTIAGLLGTSLKSVFKSGGILSGVGDIFGFGAKSTPIEPQIQSAGTPDVAENLGERGPFSKSTIALLDQFKKTSAPIDATQAQIKSATDISTASGVLASAGQALKEAAATIQQSFSGTTTAAATPNQTAAELPQATVLSQQIEGVIAQRNEAQRIIPTNDQQAAQQAETVRVLNLQLEALVDLRSHALEQAGKTAPVKITEPVLTETDITRISSEAATEFAQVTTPPTEAVAIPEKVNANINTVATATQQTSIGVPGAVTSQPTLIPPSAISQGIASSLNTAGETLIKAGADLSSAAAALSNNSLTTQSSETNQITTLNRQIEEIATRRDEAQKIIPANDQQATQQVETVKVLNSRLEELVELRSRTVEQTEKTTPVKVTEPIQADITQISPEVATEFAQATRTPSAEIATVPQTAVDTTNLVPIVQQEKTTEPITTETNITRISSEAVTELAQAIQIPPKEGLQAPVLQRANQQPPLQNLERQTIGSNRGIPTTVNAGISAIPSVATQQVTSTIDTLDAELGRDISDAAAEQINKLAEVQSVIVDQSSKIQPTELVQVSSEAATEFAQASTNDQPKQTDTLAPAADAIVQSADASSSALTGSANSLSEAAVSLAEAAARLQLSSGGSGGGSNVHLGPSQSPEADAVNNLGDAIENLGERKPISTVSTGNSPSFSTAGLSLDNLSFADINKTLGPLLGLAGGTAAAPFASKASGALSASNSITSLFKNLQSLGLFGSSASPFLQSGGINFATSGALMGDLGAASSGGFFSSIGSGLSSIWDFFSSFFHEGGLIEKHSGGAMTEGNPLLYTSSLIEKRMHVGGLADDTIPIIGQHGEYMLGESAVSGIGRQMLDMEKLPKFHTGGLAHDEVPLLAPRGGYMLQKSAVANVGKHVLDMINTTGRLPKFHNGGAMLGEKPPTGLSIPTHALASLSGANKNAENDPHIKLGSPTQQYSAGQQHVDAQPIHQNIYVVDKRPPNLSQNDVVVMVENDMIGKNGRTARAVQNVIKRTR